MGTDAPNKSEADIARMAIADNPEERRWEAMLDGSVVGYSEYRRAPGRRWWD